MKNHIPKIEIKSIAHKSQRYPTVGDYFKKGRKILFRISQMNFKYEMLVLIHELVEWFLITVKEVPMEAIDTFDIEFENNRKSGDFSEPGNDPKAPYHHEHVFASEIERKIADYLGVDWEAYDKYVNEL